MIELLNKCLNMLSRLIMRPFYGMSLWVSLAWVSFLLALLILAVFRVCAVSEQLRKTRNVVLARLLEFRLFKDDLGALFGIWLRVFGACSGYLFAAVKPLIILMAPMILLMMQLEYWYEREPLQNGDKSLITLTCNKETDWASVDIKIKSSDGLAVETAAFKSPDNMEIVWRFGVHNAESPQWLDITIGSEIIRRYVAVGKGVQKVLPIKNISLDNGLIKTIEIDYQPRKLMLGAITIDWLVVLFLITIFFMLTLKPILQRIAVAFHRH